MPSLSFGEIAYPAYLVNSRFEVVWLNDAAGSAAWPNFVPMPPVAVSHGVFQYLLKGQSQSVAIAPESRAAILRLHLGLARQRGASLSDLCREIPQGEMPAGGQHVNFNWHVDLSPLKIPAKVPVNDSMQLMVTVEDRTSKVRSVITSALPKR